MGGIHQSEKFQPVANDGKDLDDYEKKEPTFVMKKYAQDPRYQRENDIFHTPEVVEEVRE